MEKIKTFVKTLQTHRIFKIAMWVFLVLVGLFIVLVITRVFYFFDLDKTNAQVEKIHATKLTMADVLGKNLPPDPGAEADKTVAGIDANNNGIRDDVELAVFREYPDSAKTRAVLLQYALALQMETTQPFVNTTIATEVVREQSRGFQCVGNIVPDSYERLDLLIKFVKNKQFNTEERQNARDIFLKDVRSYSDLDLTCDIDITKLQN